MRLHHPPHLTWVLLCGCLFFFGQGAVSGSEEAVKEVTAPNGTIERSWASLKIRSDQIDLRPSEKSSEGANAVPLSPEDEVVADKVSDPRQSGESVDSVPSSKLVPEQSERIPKTLDVPNANAVVGEPFLPTQDKTIAKLEADPTETPDEFKTTVKSSNDESSQYDFSPKGRTLSYDKDNSSSSDNADLLKNTVPSEPKAVKLEENTDKDGERWLKKQRGISSTGQSTTEFKSRAKERNLSGSYIPALAVLNAVNNTSESVANTDKFIKYQRRKRPWSAQLNSSDLTIPEETTVWSLASLKATPKEKPYGDVKPVAPWSTGFNRPTTEYQTRPSSIIPTSAPPPLVELSSSTSPFKRGSDRTGVSKIDDSVVTNKPVKLLEGNFTNPSSFLNLIDSSSDKEILNETVNSFKSDAPVKNGSRPSNSTRTPEFSNVINEPEVPIKALPSPPPPPPATVPAVSPTESVKNLSIYPSPISNSVNELLDEADPELEGPLSPVESSHSNNVATVRPTPNHPVIEISTEGAGKVPLVGPSLNNSNHPNITKMFSGKDSYASNFDSFMTPSTVSEISTEKSNLIREILKSSQNETTSTLKVNTTLPSVPTTTKSPSTMSTIEKIAHVTSTMLPDKSNENHDKVSTVPATSSRIPESSSTHENDFSIKLIEMFKGSRNAEQSTAASTVTDLNAAEIFNSTTAQPKEVNEIPLDLEKVSTSTEKISEPILTLVSSTSIPPPVSESEQVNIKNETEHKKFAETNSVTLRTDLSKSNTSEEVSRIADPINESDVSDVINSTEESPSTFSKSVDATSSADNVTLPVSIDEPPTDVIPEDDSSLDTSQSVKGTKEPETSAEIETRTPNIPSYSVDNSSRIQEDSTLKFYPTTEESVKIPATPELTPSPPVEFDEGTNSDPELTEDQEIYNGRDETTFDSSDPVFTRLLVQADDKELCSSKEQLRDSIVKLFRTNGSDIHRKQVIINNLGSKECLFRKTPADEGLYPIQVYLTDSEGRNDVFLTDRFIDLWQQEGLDFYYPVKRVDKVIGRSKWVENSAKSDGNSSLIAAIIISSIAGVCLLFIVILLFIIRKRQKGFNYGQRCTPVSLEDYSLDNISVYNSSRRKAARASKRSYGNPAFDDPAAISHVVNFATLANFSTNRSLMDEEFCQIPTVSVKPDELPPGVETKNRFANVIPIPETRVTLSSTKGTDPDIDSYINANFVKGSKGEEKFYIACQAPMADTVADFWQMIWEQQSRLIIMLTDLQEGGVEKCADYLPPSEVLDCHRVFGDLQVTLKKREVRENYVISNLQLKNLESNLWREVVHMWLTSWPTQGVPSAPTPIIAFLIEARSYIKSKENSSPLVVHCSPGTGRTGTVIAIDICIRDFEIKRTVDVPRTVANIRRDRAGAVQTKDQYAFIYQVLHTYATKLTGGGLDSI